MNEQELLADCLRRLNRASVAYYLTGSMASNYWGIPRTTHDLDFVVRLPMSAVPRIIQEFSGDFYIEEAAVRAAEAVLSEESGQRSYPPLWDGQAAERVANILGGLEWRAYRGEQ